MVQARQWWLADPQPRVHGVTERAVVRALGRRDYPAVRGDDAVPHLVS